MDQCVADFNIRHFKRLIAEAHNETERQSLFHLLAAEAIKLVAVPTAPTDFSVSTAGENREALKAHIVAAQILVDDSRALADSLEDLIRFSELLLAKGGEPQ